MKQLENKLILYEIINHKIEHEDSLFNQRITWFVTSQALLFLPIFNLLTAVDIKKSGDLLLCLLLIGLISFFLVCLSCQASHIHINQLINEYNKITNNLCISEDITITMGSTPYIRFIGLFASFGSIFLFSNFWIYLVKINFSCQYNIAFLFNFITNYIIVYNVFDILSFDLPRHYRKSKTTTIATKQKVILNLLIIILLVPIYIFYFYFSKF